MVVVPAMIAGAKPLKAAERLPGVNLPVVRPVPGAAFAVGFKPGFAAGGATTGPLVTQSGSKGTHGYLNTLPDMRASFFIAGPGIPAGKLLGEVDMRDIAPTLARVLGIRVPRADGRNLLATP